MRNLMRMTDGGSPQTRTHNKQNEITAVSGATSPTFDSNGNMTTDETGKQYVYDAWNRLKIVKNSGGTTLKTYVYDALGRRVAETAGGVTTDFYYSADWQVLEERDTARTNDTKARYVWSPVYVDAMVLRDRDTADDGTLEERLWVQQDANFNVTALTNSSGTVLERYVYDPYGVATVLNASWSSIDSSVYGWVHLHQGGRLDATSGLYHFRNRDYSPTLGRWTAMDPIAYESKDTNLYRYVRNTPQSNIDPFGLADRKLTVYAFEGFGGYVGNIIGLVAPLKPNNGIVYKTIAGEVARLNVKLDYHYRPFAGGPLFGIFTQRSMEKDICSDFMIIGYSWGGATAARLAKNVAINTKIKVPLVFTIDPVGQNVKLAINPKYDALQYADIWINWYQKKDTKSIVGIGIKGSSILNAENHEVTFADYPKLDPLHGHTEILRISEMHESLRNAISDLLE